MKYDVPERVRKNSPSTIHDMESYAAEYAKAVKDPNAYWLAQTAERVTWRTKPTKGLTGDFKSIVKEPLRWFEDGKLNVSETCLDRHLEKRGDKTAILWEGDEPGTNRTLTYRELHAEVCKFANGLQSLGAKAGDRIIIYMGMVPEAAIAMLACARIGAVHSVVFGGFSASSIKDRIEDSEATMVITQDVGLRGGKKIPLKQIADEACASAKTVKKVVVYKRTDEKVAWTEGRDHWWHDVTAKASAKHEAVVVDAEHPLFILYTSGSTGRPKGLLHTSGGYITYASYTHGVVFDPREDDVYACVADVGWITGHSYVVYGPLANGVTTVMFESIPTYPDAGRYWDLVQRHKITIFYGAPTALRTLAAAGADFVKKYDRSSLRVLGTVGEPISPETWVWYHDVVGDKRCSVVDTWWQTETGGIAISPLAPATPQKPGSATLPLPGIVPSLRTEKGEKIDGAGEGRLCLDIPWPGQARTVYGDHKRFIATYFETFPGLYFTGDGCRRDEDGYYWITGRVDDVLNVSGHRIGTAEIESAIATVPAVAESAVVGYPHDVKGQGVYAYVVARSGQKVDVAMLNEACRKEIGAHTKIDRMQIVPGLPKTRSGKVMRRILRKIAEGTDDNLGDLTTLADPAVVETIKAGKITQ